MNEQFATETLKNGDTGPKLTGEFGPIYGVTLIDDLPLGTALKPGQFGSYQALPSRCDLECCRRRLKHQGGDRIVAGFEVLLSKFMKLNQACLKFLDADRSDHLVTRLSDSEMAAVEEMRKAVVHG